MDPKSAYDEKFTDIVENIDPADLSSEETLAAVKVLEIFSRSQYQQPEREPTPTPETGWEKFKLGAAKIWDNETTRVALKAGGSLAGIGLVVYSTIHKDHVLERSSLQQANQRNS